VRGCAALLAVLATMGSAAHDPQAPLTLKADALLAAYEAGDDGIVTRSVTTLDRFQSLRGDLLMGAVNRWSKAPRRVHYVFMIEVAMAGLAVQDEYWLDVVAEATKFITRRPDPPGQNPSEDVFEIAWHKTAVALLCSQRRPDFVEKHGVAPLRKRMVAQRPASGESVLVDPWIELARGFAEEGFSLLRPPAQREIGTVGHEALIQRGPAALEHYGAAMAYPSTRGEAAARKAWVLLRLDRASDALATLNTFDDQWTADQVVRYWIRLFRGAALDKLGRPEEAIHAYEEALSIAPGAQSPRVAIMGLELARDRRDAAYALATAVRTAPEAYTDPWWLYGFGERRFLVERLAALRADARRLR
jgi:tetratricopeptide (TPR) repeat protein